MYSISDYGAMIADKVRIGAFARALGQVIEPDSIVVDVGTGTGIFALLACRLGARRVHAIEPDDAIQLAREMASVNGYADRIHFHQALSTEVSLRDRADVIISDIGGTLPWFGNHIRSIADARRRFLAHDGVLIPQQDAAWAAVIESPDWYEDHTGPWHDHGFDLDMTVARRFVTNTFGKGRVTEDQLLTDARHWKTIDYRCLEETDVCGSIEWTVTREGVGHGLAAGFDRVVLPGIQLSNAPGAPESMRPERTYPHLLFPWQVPVRLAVGDHVSVDLEARLIGEDYVWSWKTVVREHGPSGIEKARFGQSTFFGAPLTPDKLRKRGAGYTPTLSEDGRMARFALDLMSQRIQLGDIARRLSTEFAGRFQHSNDTLGYVADLSQKYC